MEQQKTIVSEKQKAINTLEENFEYWKGRENKLKIFLNYADDLPDDIRNKIKSEISFEIEICAEEKQRISDEYHIIGGEGNISFEESYGDLTPEQEDYIIESGMEEIRLGKLDND